MKKLMKTGVSALAALVMSGAVASAQNFSFTASGKAPPPASDGFDVTINRVGVTDTFSVSVTALSTNSAADKLNPVRNITISFYDCPDDLNAQGQPNGDTVTVLSAAGGTTAGGPSAKDSTVYLAAAWQGNVGPAVDAEYASPISGGVQPNNLKLSAYGNNTFNGLITLAPFTQVGAVDIVLEDHSQTYYGFAINPNAADCVPEAGSLAMLLPGLAPLGLALRRRRMARV